MKKPSKKAAAAVGIVAAITMSAEGLRQTAYYDPPGILTVCYGSTKNVEKGRVYSAAECLARLDRDLLEAVEIVERCVPNAPVPVLAAFGDAVYNMGPTIACNTKASTAARYLKAGQWKEACDQLPRWDKARVGGVMVALPGLTRRRKAERELCLTPDSP